MTKTRKMTARERIESAITAVVERGISEESISEATDNMIRGTISEMSKAKKEMDEPEDDEMDGEDDDYGDEEEESKRKKKK